jgi:hypothetical protein
VDVATISHKSRRGYKYEVFYKLEREKMSPQKTAQIAAEAKANCHEMGCPCQECLLSNEDFLKEAQEQDLTPCVMTTNISLSVNSYR